MKNEEQIREKYKEMAQKVHNDLEVSDKLSTKGMEDFGRMAAYADVLGISTKQMRKDYQSIESEVQTK